MLMLTSELKLFFKKSKNAFKDIMRLKGEVFRALENRKTQKILLNNQHYFIKQHYGIGWKEIFKNIFQLRLPVLSAKNEWLAINKLQSLGVTVQTIVGYGKKGFNPARQRSFLITQELTNHISLEDLCREWKRSPPEFSFKKELIKKLALIARILHSNGINHRDFYLCHFLLCSLSQNLCLIDLHRAQIRNTTPVRWVIKDLAGLYFSSKNSGLTQRDFLRFIIEYRKRTIREVFNKEAVFWQKVKKRGDKLYQQHET